MGLVILVSKGAKDTTLHVSKTFTVTTEKERARKKKKERDAFNLPELKLSREFETSKVDLHFLI